MKSALTVLFMSEGFCVIAKGYDCKINKKIILLFTYHIMSFYNGVGHI